MAYISLLSTLVSSSGQPTQRMHKKKKQRKQKKKKKTSIFFFACLLARLREKCDKHVFAAELACRRDGGAIVVPAVAGIICR